MRRPPAAAVVALLALCLAACSVPRDRDRSTASGSGGGSSSAPAASATGGRAGLVAVPSAVAAAVPSPAVVSSSRAAVPSPSRSAVPVRTPAPHQVAGYALTASPRSLGDPLGVVRGARDLFGAATARSVSRGGAPVGVLMLLALRSEYVGNRNVEPMLVPKVVAGITSGGVKPWFETWSGLRVAVASTAKDGTIVVWYSRGVLGVVVGGADSALVTRYAKAYVASL